jgi:hypothetical protein
MDNQGSDRYINTFHVAFPDIGKVDGILPPSPVENRVIESIPWHHEATNIEHR